MRQSFADPASRHAMLVHFPIVLAILAVPFVAVLPFIARRRALAYRVILASAVFGTAVIAWQAGEAGEAAEPIAQQKIQGEAADTALARHAERGELLALLMAGNSILVFLTLVPGRTLRLASGLLALAATIALAIFVVVIAHDGGMLVYRYGAAG
ncbi:MAG: hypothetical protein MK085_04370 [Phycisphaerales bacterium]|nr:hypothetical protein [Phycisphaerales bacterium]